MTEIETLTFENRIADLEAAVKSTKADRETLLKNEADLAKLEKGEKIDFEPSFFFPVYDADKLSASIEDTNESIRKTYLA